MQGAKGGWHDCCDMILAVMLFRPLKFETQERRERD